MFRWLAAVMLAAVLLATGCSSATDRAAELAAKDRQIAELQAQVKQKDDEIASLKRSLAMTPPPPNQSTVAVGQGDGRFTVVPSKVRPGFPIGIFTDEGDGAIRIVRVSDGAEVARMSGPKASQILLHTMPKDLAPGSYRVQFSGHGGTTGEAVIEVIAD